MALLVYSLFDGGSCGVVIRDMKSGSRAARQRICRDNTSHLFRYDERQRMLKGAESACDCVAGAYDWGDGVVQIL
jgi:hypothetical protein